MSYENVHEHITKYKGAFNKSQKAINQTLHIPLRNNKSISLRFCSTTNMVNALIW